MYVCCYACTGNISLITTSECSDSKITDEESKSFFESQAPVTSIADDKPEETDDADDLVTISYLYVSVESNSLMVEDNFDERLENVPYQKS